MGKGTRNSDLEWYLRAGGTSLPPTINLCGEWSSNNKGPVFKQRGCPFCFNTLAVPDDGMCLLEYKSKSLKVVPGEKAYKVTPFAICGSCYRDGVQELEEYRARFVRDDFNGEIRFQNGIFMTDRLVNYIDSEGTVLPEDLDDYRPRSSKEGLCLFCDDSPADYPVHRYSDTEKTLKIDTSCLCCFSCQVEVTNMETRFKTVAYRAGGTAQYRINLLTLQGRHDATIEDHYLHLPDPEDENSRSPWTGHMKGHCYFCKNISTDDSTFYLQAPVGSSPEFTGGFYRCCNTCYQQLKHTYAHEPNAMDIELMFDSDSCATCSSTYYVTKAEASNRKETDTTGQHNCPKCTHIENFDKEFDPVFCNGSKDAPKRDNVHNVCHYCSDSILMDLTLSRRYLKDKFLSKEAELICAVCEYNGKFPIFVSRIPGIGLYRVYPSDWSEEDSKQYIVRLESSGGSSTTAIYNGDPENIPIRLYFPEDGKE